MVSPNALKNLRQESTIWSQLKRERKVGMSEKIQRLNSDLDGMETVLHYKKNKYGVPSDGVNFGSTTLIPTLSSNDTYCNRTDQWPSH
jgi:hypothetical protein